MTHILEGNTENQLWYATTLFGFTWDELVYSYLFWWLCLIHTCFFITTIWQIVVHSEKFLWQWGSCKPCEYFLACKWKLVYNTRSDIEIFVVHFKFVDIKIEHYHCFLQSWIFKVKRSIRDCYTLCIDKFVFLPDKQWTMHITRLLLKWIIVNQRWF